MSLKLHKQIGICLFKEGEGWGGSGPKFINFELQLIIIGKHMKMLCFKFQQNHTINKEFDFL